MKLKSLFWNYVPPYFEYQTAFEIVLLSILLPLYGGSDKQS